MNDTQAKVADLLFWGGRVITMEDPVNAAELDLAVGNGRILWIGTRGALDSLIGADTRVIDVTGKTLIPGLIDAHSHMMIAGQNMQAVDVRPSRVKSIGGILTELGKAAKSTPPGKWIKAWGYDDTLLDEKRHPVHEDLDRACPDHPVILTRICAHVAVVNSMVLGMAGITKNTKDPEGGRIGRDSEGRPNGLFFEIGATNLIHRIIPQPNPSECALALRSASDSCVQEGVTMLTEAGAGFSGNPSEAAGFQLALQSGYLKSRVLMGMMERTYRLFPRDHGLGLFTGFGDDFLRLGPIKFVLDGAIGARTAAVSQPYENSDSCGILCEDVESLTSRMEMAHLHGFQISIHSTGDRAVDTALQCYEKILRLHPRPHRHRIEHAMICRPDIIRGLRRLGITLVTQPALLYFLGDSYLRNLGPRRVDQILPLKSLINEGVVVCGSSDRPIADGNPMVGIWSAVNRLTFGGKPINASEGLDIVQALKLYTRNSAYVNFVEDRAGSLAPGKWADIVVLDQNPLEICPSDLKNIRTSMTFVNGREVYRRKTRD